MRIGSDNSFLSVDRVAKQDPGPVWRVEAASVSDGWKFAASHERVRVLNAEETLAQVSEFAFLKAQRVDMALSEGGWLRVKRHPNGQILVRYRVARMSAGRALEGEVRLEPEFAEAFYHELRRLL